MKHWRVSDIIEQRSFGIIVTISPPPSPNLLILTALGTSVMLLMLILDVAVFDAVCGTADDGASYL